MKRLTKRIGKTVGIGEPLRYYNYGDIKGILERLAAIEDILGDDYDIDRLRELVDADRDGQCVVLPCNIGTPVYRILRHCGCAAMDDESYQYVESYPAPFTIDMINNFGETVFLTREAAEQALNNM